jgi:hypothetical protein
MQLKSMTMSACLAMALAALAITPVEAGGTEGGVKTVAEACNAQAADKKLSGAEKDSFVEKCVKDASATGAKPPVVPSQKTQH